MEKEVNQVSYAPDSSIRNNIIIVFFLVLALSGIIINLIFLNAIETTLAKEGLEPGVIQQVSRNFTIIGSGVTMAGMVIVLAISFYISDKITRPLRKLSDGMLAIANGQWNTRITVDSNDEIRQLAEGFNLMGEQVEKTMSELGAAREYNANIVMSVPSIMIVLSERLNVLSVNMAFDSLKQQYPALSPVHFIRPLDRDISNNLEAGATIKKEISIVLNDSSANMIFSAVISRIGNSQARADKECARVLLTLTDITERRKMKEMVLQSRQDWEDTFNTIPDMITIHDQDYNIIMANKAAKDELNLHLLNFKSKSKCFKYYHGTNSAPKGCPSCDCMNTGESATFEVFEPHLKKYIEIRSIPRFNNNKKMIGLIHIVRDITLRKKIEEEHNILLVDITKAKVEWEMTFDSVLEYIVIVDKELRITRCNRSFSNYAGKPLESIVGSNCHDYFPCSQSQIEDCKKRMESSRELLTKNEFETESGQSLYISHRPIRDEEDEHVKSVIIATDVTELKKAQMQIKSSEKELKNKVSELEKFYDMAVGRELKMKELKKEIRKLNNKLNENEEKQPAN